MTLDLMLFMSKTFWSKYFLHKTCFTHFRQIPILANPDFVKSRFCHFVILPF